MSHLYKAHLVQIPAISDALQASAGEPATPGKPTLLNSTYDKQKGEFLLEANYLNNCLPFNLTWSLPGKGSLWDPVIRAPSVRLSTLPRARRPCSLRFLTGASLR